MFAEVMFLEMRRGVDLLEQVRIIYGEDAARRSINLSQTSCLTLSESIDFVIRSRKGLSEEITTVLGRDPIMGALEQRFVERQSRRRKR